LNGLKNKIRKKYADKKNSLLYKDVDTNDMFLSW